MQVGPRSNNSKWHGGTSHLAAEVHTDGVNQQIRSEAQHMGIPGEMHDTPGSSPRQFVAMDYGEQRHLAYDSPLAQPAYSAHGKVKTL